jgi:hypothetical protein
MVAGSGRASIPARRLAERLRELREREFGSLTQKQLATALGGSESLSTATVSLWEKPGSDRLPPPARLAAYARLFCTSRSFASGVPRLLRDDDLTEQERTREAELYQQLMDLRERAQSTDIASLVSEQRSSIWYFPGDKKTITIVCSEASEPPPYAEPSHLNYTRHASFADLDALITIYGQLRADNPMNTIQIASPDDLDNKATLNDLVLIGGMAVARATSSDINVAEATNPGADTAGQGVRRLVPKNIPLPVAEQIPDSNTHRFRCNIRDEQREFESLRDNGVLVEDVGLFARGPHPYYSGRTVTMLNGITSRGVHGAALCFIDEELREKNESYLRDTLGSVDEFCILMSVPVHIDGAVQPDLSNSDNRLYEWSPKTGARWGHQAIASSG